jgi:hypothetical protein
VLQRRCIQKGSKQIQQVLVKWSNPSLSDLQWEDYEDLRTQFPRAVAWGQTSSQEVGIVSDPDLAKTLKKGKSK